MYAHGIEGDAPTILKPDLNRYRATSVGGHQLVTSRAKGPGHRYRARNVGGKSALIRAPHDTGMFHRSIRSTAQAALSVGDASGERVWVL